MNFTENQMNNAKAAACAKIVRVMFIKLPFRAS
jgi:hypothetical protein